MLVSLRLVTDREGGQDDRGTWPNLGFKVFICFFHTAPDSLRVTLFRNVSVARGMQPLFCLVQDLANV